MVVSHSPTRAHVLASAVSAPPTAMSAAGLASSRVRSVAVGAAVLSLLVAAMPEGFLRFVGFAVLYVAWSIYKRGLDIFANLQWDSLLLEAGVLGWLLAVPGLDAAATASVIFLFQVLPVGY